MGHKPDEWVLSRIESRLSKSTMKTSRIISVALLFVMSMVGPLNLRAAEKPLTEKEKIEALITAIANLKDATFIRNGSDYNAKMAARFLRGKWQAHEKEIKTATDFIDKAASVSSTSGKTYMIRLKGASEIKCSNYLKEELKKLEKSQPDKPNNT